LQRKVLEVVSARVAKRRQMVADAVAARKARPFVEGDVVMMRQAMDLYASAKKLSHLSEGPFTVMGAGPTPGTVRVAMNRGDLVHGNVVHTSYLKHILSYGPRYWYDPLPRGADSFAPVEDGAWPGELLRLRPEDLAELDKELGGSNPLVPLALAPRERSMHCYICRKKQLLKAGAEARVDCAFCNGFAHAKCLYTEGTTRVAEFKPSLLRCVHCVRELEKVFRFVERLQLQESRKLTELRAGLGQRMRFQSAAGGAAESKG
jgi:hypothetical protein